MVRLAHRGYYGEYGSKHSCFGTAKVPRGQNVPEAERAGIWRISRGSSLQADGTQDLIEVNAISEASSREKRTRVDIRVYIFFDE